MGRCIHFDWVTSSKANIAGSTFRHPHFLRLDGHRGGCPLPTSSLSDGVVWFEVAGDVVIVSRSCDHGTPCTTYNAGCWESNKNNTKRHHKDKGNAREEGRAGQLHNKSNAKLQEQQIKQSEQRHCRGEVCQHITPGYLVAEGESGVCSHDEACRCTLKARAPGRGGR